MIELYGKYTSAKVFTDNIDNETISQVINLCNQSFIENCKIRIMPDTHAGKGCVIGFTADLGNKVIPNLIGVDIGCGILTVKLDKIDIDLEKLDNIIKQYIPAGYDSHENKKIDFDELKNLYCYRELRDTKRIIRSIGTLGGGNHFIEIDIDNDGNKYLIIHSGSRNLGKQVAELYQNIAIENCTDKKDYNSKKDNLIKLLKENGKKNQISIELNKLNKKYKNLHPDFQKDLCFLTGENKDKYLYDMKICQEYAELNRQTIASIIIDKLLKNDLNRYEHFHTIHNYINFNDNIIRKGSISAYKDELVLIPINMRDGSIVAIGKGNEDYNYSAPHGAGRIMSRSKAKELINIDEYKDSMNGIYSTSICTSTIDEAPMAYKPMKEIIENIKDTVEIIDILKPIYNFKAK